MMDQLELGEALRDQGMKRADLAEDPTWNERCDAAIIFWARQGRPFSVDDVTDIVGRPAHPNALGARFSAAHRAGIIRVHSYTTAKRAERHASSLRVWVGV